MDKEEDQHDRKENNKSSEIIYIDERLRKPYIIPADRMERERRIAEKFKELAKSHNELFVSVHIDVSVNEI